MKARTAKARTASRVIWSVWFVLVGLTGATVFLAIVNRGLLDQQDALVGVAMAVAGVGYGTVGALITARRQNRIGWIFCTIGVGFVLYGFTWGYVVRGLVGAPGALPGIAYLAWVRTWVITLAFAPIPLLLLLFPDGRLPSRKWRRVAWVLIVLPSLNLISTALQRGPVFEQFGLQVQNPFGVPGIGSEHGPWLAFVVPALVWFGAAVAAAVALVQRFRRSTGEERQQLRWLAYVAGTALVLLVPGLVLGSVAASRILPVVALSGFLVALLVGIPVASAIAIFRYRLYDLDVVIKKTVVLGVLAVLVAGLYVGIVVGIGSVVTGSETSPSSILTFAAAAVLALAFQPVRRGANHLANRMVYGERATPYEVLSDFSDRVAGEYSTDDVLPRMAEILGAGTGARRADVWLRVGNELRLVAVWPTDPAEPGPIVRISGDELPEVPGASHVVPVRHQGELLGAITVAVRPSDPLTPSKERLIHDLAAQAGLVLRNVRLIEELRASRQRIVAAQDARAKALERNIHDGAQQHLVALMVKLRLAENQVAQDSQATRRVLHDLQADMGEALENLRELARGIYPPLLADRGLPAALLAQAGKAPLPVEVGADGVGRFRQEVESAVYFCCLEALQNVAKYARATCARILLSTERGDLLFRVEDDGTGFDTDSTPLGLGLQNMSDRLAALGGSVKVESELGHGTRVIGRIPAGSLAAAG
jgi:signal transduction histidine kinase